MPLYEYRCDACEHQFEVIQSFSAKPLRKCEKCGGKVRKLISRAGFVLKGGGWYASGYGSSGPATSSESADSAPSEKAAGKAGDKAADKPAAKASETSEPAAAAAAPAAAPAAGRKSSKK